MGKIDLLKAPTLFGSAYPAPHNELCLKRERYRLGKAAGLTHIGVNRLVLPKGQWSSQRHWHDKEEEFIWVLQGEVVLVTDAGEEVLREGDCAGFKAGEPNGHHLQNRSEDDAIILEIGTDIADDIAEYPDIDMRALPSGYVHKDGTPYEKKK